MAGKRYTDEQLMYLAEVAHLYYVEKMQQSEIAPILGLSRSMVSHLLTNAKDAGVVQFVINYPLLENKVLADQLAREFGLKAAAVVEALPSANLAKQIGKVGSRLLVECLHEHDILGVSWGSTISATISSLGNSKQFNDLTIVELLGVLSGRQNDYDANHHLEQLVAKLGGHGVYLNAPFIVDSPAVAKVLMENRSIQMTLETGGKSDVALLGVGTSEIPENPFFQTGYFTEEEINSMRAKGVVGDVCGHFFDENGKVAGQEYQTRLVGISLSQLKGISTRLAVAGGPKKIRSILGAIRGAYINMLVTDSETARLLLQKHNSTQRK